MINKVVSFKSKFDKVITSRLPSLWDGNNYRIALEEYKEILKNTKEDNSNIGMLAPDIKGPVVYKTL